MAPSEHDPALAQALERHGVTVRDGVDLECETGAGTRTVLVRAVCCDPTANPPWTPLPPTTGRGWPAWSGGLDDPRLARRFVTSRVLYRRLRRYLWGATTGLGRHRAPAARRVRGRRPRPCVPDAPATDGVATGLQRHVAVSPDRDGGDRSRPAGDPRPRGRHHVGARHLAGARWRRIAGSLGRQSVGLPSHCARATRTGPLRTRLDATRAAVESGVSGVIVGGALVPEADDLDTGFFACPGATSEVVHEHRGWLGLPPTFLHHRQESTLEIETGAELHVRLLLAEADLPLSTMGERIVTADTVVKGRSKAADVHAELVASWPGGAVDGRPRPRWRRTTYGCAASAASQRSCCSWPASSICSPRSRLPSGCTCT